MRSWFLLIFFGIALNSFGVELTDPPLVTNYTQVAGKLISAATNSDFAFKRLGFLCDTFGSRFSGSTNLENAIDWILAEMKKDGLENVRGEEVMVPHWVRGEESLELLEPHYSKLPMLGIGMSIGTPTNGISGEVLVVSGFDELKKRAAEAKGKIVLLNQIFPESEEPFSDYYKTVRIRTQGAVECAKVGAIACLIRSVTPFSLQTPHTGTSRYSTNSEIPKIPGAAVSLETAEMFQRMQDRGQKISVRLKMSAQTMPDVKSRNVIAEIVGREKPEEIIVVGGHIDSWDVGQGAMDDAGGCVVAWESIRLMKKFGLQPRRTIRVVLWANEENGLRGAYAYRDQHKNELDKHVVAMESDHGTFKPTGFAFRGSNEAAGYILQIGEILKSIGAGRITFGADDADSSKLGEEGVPMLDLIVDDSKYFHYHHTEADTMDKLNSHEVNLCIAATAVMSYLIAEMPETLPRD